MFFSSGEKPNLSINAKRFWNKNHSLQLIYWILFSYIVPIKIIFTFPYGAL